MKLNYNTNGEKLSELWSELDSNIDAIDKAPTNSFSVIDIVSQDENWGEHAKSVVTCKNKELNDVTTQNVENTLSSFRNLFDEKMKHMERQKKKMNEVKIEF